MAYNLKIERQGANSRQFMDDLKEVLSSNGFKVDEYRDMPFIASQEKSRGRELFVRRGIFYFSFSCSPYSDIYKTDLEQVPSPAPDDRTYTGAFGVFANTGYDQNLNFYEQPSNDIGKSFGSGCLIPYDDYFNFEIYSDKKGLNWFFHFNFEDVNGDIIRTYVFWGLGLGYTLADTNGEGSYTMGSLGLGRSGDTILQSSGYHVDPLTSSNGFGAFPVHPLMNQDYVNIYYKDEFGDYVTQSNTIDPELTTNYNRNRGFSFVRQTLEAGYNEYLGISPLFRTEITVPKFTQNERKRMVVMPAGIIKQEAAEHGEIRIVDGKKIQFFDVMRKREGQIITTHENYSFSLWIERGL